MIPDAETLPADPDALRALLLAERARHAEAIGRIEQKRDAAVGESARLRAIIQALRRHRFGGRSEQLDPDQLASVLRTQSRCCLPRKPKRSTGPSSPR